MTSDTHTPSLFPPRVDAQAFPNVAPLAAHADPMTSHRAASVLTRSGARDAQKREVLAALRRHPGVSSKQLAALAKLDRHQCGRRLPDLERDGFVRRGPEAQDGSGITWVAMEV